MPLGIHDQAQQQHDDQEKETCCEYEVQASLMEVAGAEERPMLIALFSLR